MCASPSPLLFIVPDFRVDKQTSHNQQSCKNPREMILNPNTPAAVVCLGIELFLIPEFKIIHRIFKVILHQIIFPDANISQIIVGIQAQRLV